MGSIYYLLHDRWQRRQQNFRLKVFYSIVPGGALSLSFTDSYTPFCTSVGGRKPLFFHCTFCCISLSQSSVDRVMWGSLFYRNLVPSWSAKTNTPLPAICKRPHRPIGPRPVGFSSGFAPTWRLSNEDDGSSDWQLTSTTHSWRLDDTSCQCQSYFLLSLPSIIHWRPFWFTVTVKATIELSCKPMQNFTPIPPRFPHRFPRAGPWFELVTVEFYAQTNASASWQLPACK